MKVPLTIEKMLEMDGGKLSGAIAHELAKVAEDMKVRSGDTKVRKINVQLEFQPDERDPAVGWTRFKVKSTVPDQKSRDYSVAVHGKHGLVVNPESPDDVRQSTLDEQ